MVFDVNQGGTKSHLLPYTIQFPYVQILEFEKFSKGVYHPPNIVCLTRH